MEINKSGSIPQLKKYSLENPEEQVQWQNVNTQSGSKNHLYDQYMQQDQSPHKNNDTQQNSQKKISLKQGIVQIFQQYDDYLNMELNGDDNPMSRSSQSGKLDSYLQNLNVKQQNKTNFVREKYAEFQQQLEAEFNEVNEQIINTQKELKQQVYYQQRQHLQLKLKLLQDNLKNIENSNDLINQIILYNNHSNFHYNLIKNMYEQFKFQDNQIKQSEVIKQENAQLKQQLLQKREKYKKAKNDLIQYKDDYQKVINQIRQIKEEIVFQMQNIQNEKQKIEQEKQKISKSRELLTDIQQLLLHVSFKDRQNNVQDDQDEVNSNLDSLRNILQQVQQDGRLSEFNSISSEIQQQQEQLKNQPDNNSKQQYLNVQQQPSTYQQTLHSSSSQDFKLINVQQNNEIDNSGSEYNFQLDPKQIDADNIQQQYNFSKQNLNKSGHKSNSHQQSQSSYSQKKKIPQDIENENHHIQQQYQGELLNNNSLSGNKKQHLTVQKDQHTPNRVSIKQCQSEHQQKDLLNDTEGSVIHVDLNAYQSIGSQQGQLNPYVTEKELILEDHKNKNSYLSDFNNRNSGLKSQAKKLNNSDSINLIQFQKYVQNTLEQDEVFTDNSFQNNNNDDNLLLQQQSESKLSKNKQKNNKDNDKHTSSNKSSDKNLLNQQNPDGNNSQALLKQKLVQFNQMREQLEQSVQQSQQSADSFSQEIKFQ